MGSGADWYKDAIIYEVHVKCFFDSDNDGVGDFKGLTEKLDYLQDLGITAIWLLPFYPSPLRDDGYDIADYRAVHKSYGSMNDFRFFLREAHKRGLKVITELVINHTSDQHPWFQRARNAKPGSKLRDYYVWNDSPELYKEARIIFQDFETSNWTWDPVAESYYWHRFYYHQPDLNFENEEVRLEISRILSYWLKMGVDGVRLDAVPYLFERDGTSCENLPETHQYLKDLRHFVDQNFKNRMFLAEANQWPEDAAKYFGKGDECHMAFHFPIMPRLFMAIHLEDALPIIEIAEQTPKIPEQCQWALFLRNHDELTLEMVTDEERDYMFRVYAHDPQARINLGIRRRLAPLLKNDRRKIELMNLLLFSLTGTPVLYYGDEIGMGDNIYLGDRDGVRTPMQWSNDRNAGFSRSNPQRLYLPPIIDPEYHFETVNVEAQYNNPYSLLWWTKQLISLRKRFHAFGRGKTRYLIPENRKVLVFLREYGHERILVVANLSRFAQYVELDLSKHEGETPVELFSGETFPRIGELPYFLTLGPYGYYWFALEKRAAEAELLPEERRLPHLSLKGGTKTLFERTGRKSLESALDLYLHRSRWFVGSRVKGGRLELLDQIPIGERMLHFIRVQFKPGISTTLPLLLSIVPLDTECPHTRKVAYVESGEDKMLLIDCSQEPTVGEELAQLIQDQKRIKGKRGEIKGINYAKVRTKHHLLELGEGKRGIHRTPLAIWHPRGKSRIRLFSTLGISTNLDSDIRLYLTKESSFRSFLPLLGGVEYLGQERTLFAQELPSYPDEFLASHLAMEEAERFFMRLEIEQEDVNWDVFLPPKTLLGLALGDLPPEIHTPLEGHLEVVRLLGETVAEFHFAMSQASDASAFATKPFNLFYQRSLYQTLRTKITEIYAFMKQPSLPSQKRLLDFFDDLPKKRVHALRLHHHGNLQLDQLLYTGKEFLITNFAQSLPLGLGEGSIPRSPLVDCATLLFSFAEAAYTAIHRQKSRGLMEEVDEQVLEGWATGWSIWIGSSFIRSYIRTCREKKWTFLPKKDDGIDFLLCTYLLEKCLDVLALKEGADDMQEKVARRLLTHWFTVYEPLQLL